VRLQELAKPILSGDDQAAKAAVAAMTINNTSSKEVPDIIPSIPTTDFSVNERRTPVNVGISMFGSGCSNLNV